MPIELSGSLRTQLLRREARSQRGWYRALAGGAEGSHVAEVVPGVQATVVPARPWFSVFNAVVYDDGSRLRLALPRLRPLYRSAGIGGWSVWVRPSDSEVAAALAAEGHVEEASPLVLGAPIDALDLAQHDELDLDPAPTWGDIARCNDRAHGVLAEYSMVAAFERMDDPSTRLYAARANGEIASVLLARHHDGDCYFWFVATLPEAQRKGLAAALMRVALRDARDSGCTTSTLESTAAGESLYRSLGFGPLGRAGRWAYYES